jgi:chemotaxis protein CheD
MIKRLRRATSIPGGFSTTAELMPGDVALGQEGDHLRTLLGSCVCVILTDPRRTVGVMCHIVFVGLPNAANAKNTAYGSVAMHEMFARLRAVGINPHLCDAYVYGGGNMFPAMVRERHVGVANVDWVMDYLDQQGIRVVEHSLGGSGYRKVSWYVGPEAPVLETVEVEMGNTP